MSDYTQSVSGIMVAYGAPRIMVMTRPGLDGSISFAGLIPARAIGKSSLSGLLFWLGGGPQTMVLTLSGLDGSVSFAGTVQKATARILTGAVTLSATLRRGIGRLITGVLSLSGVVFRTPKDRIYKVPAESRTYTAEDG